MGRDKIQTNATTLKIHQLFNAEIENTFWKIRTHGNPSLYKPLSYLPQSYRNLALNLH